MKSILFFLVLLCVSQIDADFDEPELLWKFGGCREGACGDGWYSSPVFKDGVVYGTTRPIFAVDATTGETIWKINNGKDSSSPFVVGDDLGFSYANLVLTEVDDETILVYSSCCAEGAQTAAYDLDGNFKWGPVNAGEGGARSLGVARLKEGEEKSVAVGIGVSSVWHANVLDASDGSQRDGFPQRDSELNPKTGAWGSWHHNLGLFDVDGDGEIEILLPCDQTSSAAYQQNGKSPDANWLDGEGHLWGDISPSWDELYYIDELGVESPCDEAGWRSQFAYMGTAAFKWNGRTLTVTTGHVRCISDDSDKWVTIHIWEGDHMPWESAEYNWRFPPAALTGFPISRGGIGNANTQPVIADLEGDGEPEILFSGWDGKVYAVWLDQSQQYSWPFDLNQDTGGVLHYGSEPVVVDLDGNGDAEVIVGTWTEEDSDQYGRLYILDYRGEELYRVDLPASLRESSKEGGCKAAPTVGDIDLDTPGLEIALLTHTAGLVLYNIPGSDPSKARLLWPTGRANMERTADVTSIVDVEGNDQLPPPEPVCEEVPKMGYIQRPCGFDLDDNGISGEDDDCQKICNGDTNVDVDGDGVIENQLYIDCDDGSNTATCGTPDSPCKTIEYTWTTRAVGDGTAEDILCFTGTCRTENNIYPGVSGVPGHRVKIKSGSEEWDFQYPTNPTMLVGWDKNDNGEYPPYDTDDVSVIDGGTNELDRLFHFGVEGPDSYPSYVEMAHFTVKDYGQNENEGTGFIKFGTTSSTGGSHVYFHDLELIDINREKTLCEGCSGSSTLIFNWFGGAGRHYHSFENLDIENFSIWMARGGQSGETIPDAEQRDQHIRFQNIKAKPLARENSAFTLVKMWGFFDKLEWIDNYFDADPETWKPNGNRVTGILINQCQQETVIRNNAFINWAIPIAGKGSTVGFCTARPVDKYLIEENYLLQDTDYWGLDGGIAFNFETEDEPNVPISGSIKDVTIRRNVVDIGPEKGSWANILFYAVGAKDGPIPGQVIFDNNWITNDGSLRNGRAAILLGDPDKVGKVQNKQNNFEITNNVFRGYDTTDDSQRFLIRAVDYSPNNVVLVNNEIAECAWYEWEDQTYESFSDFVAADHLAEASDNYLCCCPTVSCSLSGVIPSTCAAALSSFVLWPGNDGEPDSFCIVPPPGGGGVFDDGDGGGDDGDDGDDDGDNDDDDDSDSSASSLQQLLLSSSFLSLFFFFFSFLVVS